MSQSYEDRILRVVKYIHANPAGDLSLDRLAEVAAMSRFHWHRVFHGMMGETCADMVRRVRLHQAALLLAQQATPVAQIADAVGYPSLQSFGRAFRGAYGMSPSAYRKQRTPLVVVERLKPEDYKMFDVKIEERAEMRLAGLTHSGAYAGIAEKFEQLSALATTRGIWPKVRGVAGMYEGDPAELPEAELRSFAGLILASDAIQPTGLEARVYPAGRVAVLSFTGPYSSLSEAYQFLYGRWLPESGEEPAEAPCYEIYLNSPADTPAEKLQTEICVLLREGD